MVVMSLLTRKCLNWDNKTIPHEQCFVQSHLGTHASSKTRKHSAQKTQVMLCKMREGCSTNTHTQPGRGGGVRRQFNCIAAERDNTKGQSPWDYYPTTLRKTNETSLNVRYEMSHHLPTWQRTYVKPSVRWMADTYYSGIYT